MILLNRILFFLIVFLSAAITSKGSKLNADSTLQLFPNSRIYPAVFLDPLECQIYGGSYLLFQDEKSISLYSNFTFGFTKPIFQIQKRNVYYEFNLGASTFTQFDLIRKDDGTFLAGLLNNDYKISTDLSIKKNNNLLRIRIFHISSHLGDDYMVRNIDLLPNDKSVNYEQVDLTYLRLRDDNYWYLGVGEIYTKYVFRDRLSFQGGGLVSFLKRKQINLFASINVKVLAQNSYSPDIRSAFGFNFYDISDSKCRIWLEYYNGYLPYSTLKYGRVNWLGLALWLNIF